MKRRRWFNMNSPSDGFDGLIGATTSMAAFIASYFPSEESLRILCLLFSIVASATTIIRVLKK